VVLHGFEPEELSELSSRLFRMAPHLRGFSVFGAVNGSLELAM
jgi:hypothetical protein